MNALFRWFACATVGLVGLSPLASLSFDYGVSYHGCVDSRNRQVLSVEDAQLGSVAQAAMDDGEPVVRHNPALLPQLSSEARLFLFARECGRHALGHPLQEKVTVDRVLQASCWAIATLQASGMWAGVQGMQALGAELSAVVRSGDPVADSIPGFDPGACAVRGVLGLPRQEPASADRISTDQCVHGCGDHLWHCQLRCRADACRKQCETAFYACEGSCTAR